MQFSLFFFFCGRTTLSHNDCSHSLTHSSRNGKFVETGEHFWFPDDVTLGYIIGACMQEYP